MEIPLYKYQKRAVKRILENGGKGALFMGMGTGKTRTAFAIATSDGTFPRLVIIIPNAASSVWQDEIKALNLPYKALDLTEGPIKIRAAKLRKVYNYPEPFVVLVNFEAFWREPLRRALLKFPTDGIVIDEAHRIKNRGARQSRFAHILGDRSDLKYKIAGTGSPVAKGIEDLYSIYRFINPDIFGRTWAEFSERYLVFGGYFKHKIVDYIRVKEIKRKLKKTSFQISKSKALDLPEQVSLTVNVKLSKKNQKLYKNFAKDSLAKVTGIGEDGRLRRGTALANIVLTSMVRLQQITSGFIVTEAGETIDIGDEKLKACLELIEDARESNQKVVVFCRFRRDLTRLADRLPEAAILRGGMSKAKRDSSIEKLRSGKTDVLLAQIDRMESIDLTAASVAIYYSVSFDLIAYTQSRDRLHRHGQVNKVTYYHLVAGPIDLEIYRSLASKQDIASLVTNLDYAKRALQPELNIDGKTLDV